MSTNGKSYLTTSKEVNADYGNFEVGDYLNEDSPIYPKMNVLSHTHNHPGGREVPSAKDMENANNLKLVYPIVKCYIYNKAWGLSIISK